MHLHSDLTAANTGAPAALTEAGASKSRDERDPPSGTLELPTPSTPAWTQPGRPRSLQRGTGTHLPGLLPQTPLWSLGNSSFPVLWLDG